MLDRSHLLTEKPLAESAAFDLLSVRDAVALMNAQDAVAVAAVGRVGDAIARAVEVVAAALGQGGRLFYVGAGTSGRLGILDAAECPPTFRTDPEQVQGLIAGGEAAVFRAVEGAEDDAAAGGRAIDERGVGPRDVVLGIAAGGTTPFVRGALVRAAALGARTVFLACVEPTGDDPPVDLDIRPLTGPEVISGSTRLKAGTATKLVLNAITTVAMSRLGKVHGNLMVDLRATNAKLRDRALRILQTLCGVDRQRAASLLDAAGGHVKLAVVMHAHNLDPAAAVQRLNAAGGNLRRALAPPDGGGTDP